MRKQIILLIAALMSIGLMAQTAINVYDFTLEDGEAFVTSVYIDNDAYAEQEKAIAKDFANQLSSSAIFRTIVGDGTDYYHKSIEQGINGLIVGTKGDQFSPLIDWYHVRTEATHKLIQNKIFRNFMEDRACEILKVICRLYPASTKQVILNKIDKASRVLDEMSKHSYSMVKTPHKYYDGSVYYDIDLQKDGKTFGNNMTQQEMDVVYGLEGWFARRLVMDGVSIAEMKEFFRAARQAVAGVDASQKPMYTECYIINNDLKVLVGTDDVFCQFNGGKKVYKLYSITYLKDPTGAYYQIISNAEDVWVMSKNKWERQATSALYSSKGEKVFEEKITLK